MKIYLWQYDKNSANKVIIKFAELYGLAPILNIKIHSYAHQKPDTLNLRWVTGHMFILHTKGKFLTTIRVGYITITENQIAYCTTFRAIKWLLEETARAYVAKGPFPSPRRTNNEQISDF